MYVYIRSLCFFCFFGFFWGGDKRDRRPHKVWNDNGRTIFLQPHVEDSSSATDERSSK